MGDSRRSRRARNIVDVPAIEQEFRAGATIEQLAQRHDIDPEAMQDIVARLGITQRAPELPPHFHARPTWMIDLYKELIAARKQAGLSREGLSRRMGRHKMDAAQVEHRFFTCMTGKVLRYLDALGLRLTIIPQGGEQPQVRFAGRDALPRGWVPQQPTPEWSATIIATLNEHRQRRRLTQRQLGEDMGLDQSQVSRVLKDYPHVRASTLFRMADTLGLRLIVVSSEDSRGRA